MDKEMIKSGIQKYTMILVLLCVTLFFAWRTNGSILYPQNISNLIAQNAYVFVLTTTGAFYRQHNLSSKQREVTKSCAALNAATESKNWFKNIIVTSMNNIEH